LLVPVIECSLPLLSVHTGKGNTLFEATILHKVRFNLRQFGPLAFTYNVAYNGRMYG
jgi:hypothetical protein